MNPSHPPGLPMTLGNMGGLGVQRLIASYLKSSCRHEGLIDVWNYRADTEVPSFARKATCAKCGARSTELEGTAARPEPDRQGVAMNQRRRDAWRREMIITTLLPDRRVVP
jgi:hypothetical protein